MHSHPTWATVDLDRPDDELVESGSRGDIVEQLRQHGGCATGDRDPRTSLRRRGCQPDRPDSRLGARRHAHFRHPHQ
jgi:hypothetical protein